VHVLEGIQDVLAADDDRRAVEAEIFLAPAGVVREDEHP
jgi:hypothetical protein